MALLSNLHVRNLKRDSEFVTKSAVNEAHEYNGDKKLK